jgi:hypothetical protein
VLKKFAPANQLYFIPLICGLINASASSKSLSMDQAIIEQINQSLELSLPEKISAEELHQRLTGHINHLINHDFEKLVFYLYRIDVNESKMKKLLDQREGENAAGLIADLIIERQLEKIKSRKESKQKGDIPEDEKW